MRRSLTYTLTPLIRSALEHPERLTASQATDLGQASRALFHVAWDAEPRDHRIIGAAIAGVVRTFESARDESEKLLRRIVEPDRLREHGHEEVPALAHEIARLFVIAPELAADVYDAVFSYTEESDAATVMLGGVMSLTSNRRQDYDMAQYELAEIYPQFLGDAPAAAIRALVAVANAYAEHRAYGGRRHDPEMVLREDAEPAVFRPDRSSVWDQGNFGQESAVRILDSFAERLDALTGEEPAAAQELIKLVLDQEVPAAIWRRMFAAAARRPDILAAALAPLAGTAVVLESSDLFSPAIDCLAAAFPHLGNDTRAAIEATILDLAKAEHGDEDRAERRRDHVLGRLPEEALVTPEGRERYAALKDSGRAPVDPPPPFDDGWRPSGYDERAYLMDEGVDVDSEPNRRLQDAAEPVRAFASAHLNDIPTAEAARQLVPALQALLQATEESSGAHQLQTDVSWGHLAAAARAISRQSDLSYEDDVIGLAERILLAASEHEEPRLRDGEPARFDENPSWGSPAPRVDAADGLIHLASRPDSDHEVVLAEIDRLRTDPVTVVRYRIAQTIALLSNSELERMWEVIDGLATDASTAVREALVTSLHLLLRVDRTRSLDMVCAIYSAIEEAPGSVRLRLTCLEVASDVYVWDGDAAAQQILDELIENLPSDHEAAGRVVFRLRTATKVGPVDPADSRSDMARERTLGFIERLLAAADDARRTAAEGQPQRMDEWSEEALSKWRNAMKLIDNITSELYFASGAYDARKDQGVRPRAPSAAETRFYSEASGIIDGLVDIGLPRVAHHLLETLEHFVDVDPRGVFMRIVSTIRAGQPYGYQYDNVAEPVFVRLVERYLAEHRTLLQQDMECSRALVEILDIFVRAGWPSARKLTYGLSEIYR